MIYYRLKHLCGNDLNKLLDHANHLSVDLCHEGHQIRRMDVFLDKASIHHNRKASHSIVIHFSTEINEKPEDRPPANY